MGVAPVKGPSWKPGMIPGYFWLGGIAAGSWLVASADDITGERDPQLTRRARYTAAVALGGGTVLLIADLGRPERFLNMLRVVRPRSAMNVGAWGLSAFGGAVGLGTALQALRDARGAGDLESGRSERQAALDRAIHILGLAPGLFVGSYTGSLLGSTSVPAWSVRNAWLSPLFAAASISSGTGALLVLGELRGWRSVSTPRRLARAQAVALAIELALSHVSERPMRRLPSQRARPADERALRALAHGGAAIGMLCAVRGAMRAEGRPSVETDVRYRRYYGRVGPEDRADDRAGGRARLAAGILALAGGLALRFLTTRSGRRSALTPEDTWEHARRG